MRVFLLAAMVAATLAPASLAQPMAIWRLADAPGRLWADVSADVPPPDSGAVADGAGTMRWSAAESDVASAVAVVEGGTIRRVTFTFMPASASARRMDEAMLQLKQVVGMPADPPFYTAEQLQSGAPSGWVDIWFDSARHRVVLRQPSDPPPAMPAVPPPPSPPVRVK